jgi:hypothetical protein
VWKVSLDRCLDSFALRLPSSFAKPRASLARTTAPLHPFSTHCGNAWCCIAANSHRPLASAVASHPCCEADRAVRPFIIQPLSCSSVAAIFSAVSPFLIVFSAFLPRRLLLAPPLRPSSAHLHLLHPGGPHGSLSTQRPSHVISDHNRDRQLVSVDVGSFAGRRLALFRRSLGNSACLSPVPA